MYVPDIEFHETKTLNEATTLMKRFAPDVRYYAGGTDLLVDLKAGRISVGHLVSLNGIDELRGITETTDGVRIGALTTITQLNRSPLIRKRFSPILDASRQMAAPPIRNVATVGGNIISAVSCADLPPIFMVLGAAVNIWSPDQSRTIPMDTLFAGPRQTVLRGSELLESVFIANLPAGFGAAYERFGLREGNAIAVASVAASLVIDGNDRITNARLVIGAVAPIPKLVSEVHDLLIGEKVTQALFDQAAALAQQAAQPISDVRGTADFRRNIIEVLSRRALIKAHLRALEVRS